MKPSWWLLPLAMLLLLSCGSGATPSGLDPDRVAQGREIYRADCAECHGPNGEGEPNWKRRRADGTFPAPPHTAEGHTWHHGDGTLFSIIKAGGAGPNSAMPAFGDRLTDQEIVAVLAYVKSLWGPNERAFQTERSRDDPFPVEVDAR